jgi:glucan phosphoethanolaminetransferase (alkaline phosphatase superfamily)
MFNEINGLPAHVLIIHAAVVFTPLAALCAIAFAVLPGWRWLLRWPLLATTVFALGSVLAAVHSGVIFKQNRDISQALIATHEHRGKQLQVLMWVFTAVVLLAVVTLGGPTALASGKGAREGLASRPLQYLISAVVVLGALLVIVQVVRTGDAGSRALWAPS